jgi:hypothetical protein
VVPAHRVRQCRHVDVQKSARGKAKDGEPCRPVLLDSFVSALARGVGSQLGTAASVFGRLSSLSHPHQRGLGHFTQKASRGLFKRRSRVPCWRTSTRSLRLEMAGHFLLSAKARNFTLADVECLSEDQVHALFAQQRWSVYGEGKQVCPECGAIDSHYVVHRRHQWRCKAKGCARTFSVTTGTKLQDPASLESPDCRSHERILHRRWRRQQPGRELLRASAAAGAGPDPPNDAEVHARLRQRYRMA